MKTDCQEYRGRVAGRATPTNSRLSPDGNGSRGSSRGLGLTGFTLIEILVVVAIIGILAATILPQFIGAKHDAKVSAAKADIAVIANQLQRFNLNMDRFPTPDEGLKALVEAPAGEVSKWRGPYIEHLRKDPWGNSYQYRCPGIHNPVSFDLWSRGADGADGGEGEGADIGNWE